MTALVAATVIRFFEHSIERLAMLAVLMPIVAGVGGNAGTQTLAVDGARPRDEPAHRINTLRAVGRELRSPSPTGCRIGVLIGTGVTLIFHNPLLGAVMGRR